jgi:predicted neutral ceramidase superfamily lipid hydrolase
VRKFLRIPSAHVSTNPLFAHYLCVHIAVAHLQVRVSYLVAALCSLVWQNRKRSSFRPLPNAYFDAIFETVDVVWLSIGVAVTRPPASQSGARKALKCPPYRK